MSILDQDVTNLTLNVKLFSLTKGQKLNTKVGLHHLPTYPPPPQTFKPLPNDLGKKICEEGKKRSETPHQKTSIAVSSSPWRGSGINNPRWLCCQSTAGLLRHWEPTHLHPRIHDWDQVRDLNQNLNLVLFSSNKGRKMNTKVGLHTTIFLLLLYLSQGLNIWSSM